MTSLVLWKNARKALAHALTVDEVKDIRDKAEAVRAYAQMARDRQMEADAAELRARAERRLGVMISDMKDKGEIREGRHPKNGSETEPFPVTLKELGIDKKLSAFCQKIGGLTDHDFEHKIAVGRDRMLTEASPSVFFDLGQDNKKERRAEREQALAATQLALPGGKKYGLIYADPEWKFKPYSTVTGMDRAAENHYPTSELAALCARPVASIAAPDCVFAMWATVPMLAEAFCVLDAYGFARFDRDQATGHLVLDKSQGRYVSAGSWTKYKPGAGIGMGHWFRVDHEILLIATRGKPPAPAKGNQWRSVFDEPASKVHSEKPDVVYEMLESYFPTLPKIELNARKARPGWDRWGFDAPIEGEVSERKPNDGKHNARKRKTPRVHRKSRKTGGRKKGRGR